MSFGRWMLPTVTLAACSTAAPMVRTAPLVSAVPDGDAVVAVVRVPTPWYAPRFFVYRKFRAAVPDYAGQPGLRRKYFTMSDDGRYGGIYLWQSRAAAEAFYTPTWHARGGRAKEVRLFEVSRLLEPAGFPTFAEEHGTAMVAFGAGNTPESVDLLAASLTGSPGLIRAYLVRCGPTCIGAIALWGTLGDARRFLATSSYGGSAELYDAPVVTPGAAGIAPTPNCSP